MNDRPEAAMLFAAGLGTRMRHLTRNRPKPLLSIGGRSLLDRTLDLVDAAGIERVVVNTHYLGEQVAAHLADRPSIRISPETPQLLDTGGGLKAALPLLGEGPVFTINTDAIWSGGNPFEQLLAAWEPARMDGLMLLIEPSRATGHAGRGDFLRAPDGRLSRGAGGIYSGAQIIRTDRLAEISEPVFSLNLLWDRLLADGRLHGIYHDGGWCDVGRPEGIGAAEKMLAEAGLV